MGQRKTWSLHHVPFTMLWETFSLDYKNNWNTVVDSKISTKYFEAAYDRTYAKSYFAFTWKSKFFSNKIKKLKNKNDQKNFKTQSLCFNWIRNANKGSNETSCNRSYYVCIDTKIIFLNFFFRQEIQFEDKSLIATDTKSFSLKKSNFIVSRSMRKNIINFLKLSNPFIRFRQKRKKRLYKKQNILKRLNPAYLNLQKYRKKKLKTNLKNKQNVKKKFNLRKRKFNRLVVKDRLLRKLNFKKPFVWVRNIKYLLKKRINSNLLFKHL